MEKNMLKSSRKIVCQKKMKTVSQPLHVVFKASNYDTVSPILANTKDSDFYNFELTLPKDSFTKVTAILVNCC